MDYTKAILVNKINTKQTESSSYYQGTPDQTTK